MANPNRSCNQIAIAFARYSACMVLQDVTGLTFFGNAIPYNGLLVRHPNAVVVRPTVEVVAELLLLPLPILVDTITRILSG